ncbi:hypothetical protein Plec18170_007141 [Paecilomyces lecythidis]
MLESPRILENTSLSTAKITDSLSDPKWIINPPQSPTYVGPTSAEFGLEPSRSQLRNVMAKAAEVLGTEGLDDSREHSFTALHCLNNNDPLLALRLEEALRLLDVFHDAVGILYPCVDLDAVRAYTIEFYRNSNAHSIGPINDDWFYARDVQVLKIILATALLAETHGKSPHAAKLADSVQDKFASRLKIVTVDMKELLILVLLVSFRTEYLKAYMERCLCSTRITN